MTKVYDTIVTEENIKENLKRVENGEALTMPLAILNGEFKKRYGIEDYGIHLKKCKICGISFNPVLSRQLICSTECRKIYEKRYRENPNRKKYRRELNRIKQNIPESKWRVK